MVRTIAVVMTVSEICGHGRFAMTPEDFNSHRREAEAFLLHCWGEGRGRGTLRHFAHSLELLNAV